MSFYSDSTCSVVSVLSFRRLPSGFLNVWVAPRNVSVVLMRGQEGVAVMWSLGARLLYRCPRRLVAHQMGGHSRLTSGYRTIGNNAGSRRRKPFCPPAIAL